MRYVRLATIGLCVLSTLQLNCSLVVDKKLNKKDGSVRQDTGVIEDGQISNPEGSVGGPEASVQPPSLRCNDPQIVRDSRLALPNHGDPGPMPMPMMELDGTFDMVTDGSGRVHVAHVRHLDANRRELWLSDGGNYLHVNSDDLKIDPRRVALAMDPENGPHFGLIMGDGRVAHLYRRSLDWALHPFKGGTSDVVHGQAIDITMVNRHFIGVVVDGTDLVVVAAAPIGAGYGAGGACKLGLNLTGVPYGELRRPRITRSPSGDKVLMGALAGDSFFMARTSGDGGLKTCIIPLEDRWPIPDVEAGLPILEDGGMVSALIIGGGTLSVWSDSDQHELIAPGLEGGMSPHLAAALDDQGRAHVFVAIEQDVGGGVMERVVHWQAYDTEQNLIAQSEVIPVAPESPLRVAHGHDGLHLAVAQWVEAAGGAGAGADLKLARMTCMVPGAP